MPLLLAGAAAVLAGIALVLGLGLWEREPAPQVAAPPPTATATPPSAPATSAGVQPSFDIVRVNPEGGAVMAGRAAPDAEVVIRQSGQEIGRSRADAAGNWVFLPHEPLAPGARELTLTARDPSGREIAGQGSVLLVVPERTETAAAQPSAPLALLTGRDTPPRLLQAPSSGETQGTSKRLGIDVIDYGEDGALRFAGTAPAHAAVRLYIDNAPAGGAVAGEDGRWTATPTIAVAPGRHRLRLDQLTSRGQVTARIEVPFERAAGVPAGVGEGRIIVQRGQNLWRIARQSYGAGPRYTVIYEANREQITDPGRIYPGQVFSMPSMPGTARPTAPDR